MSNTPESPLSVSQLNRQAKQALERDLPTVWVEGELTNFAQPSSGHWYFTLKDARAQVRCAMFRGRNMMVRQPVKAGDRVVVRASVSLYEGRGDYQLIVDSLQKAGLGDLHQQYEALKQALLEEGVFADDYKQALPRYPQCIGLISSATGAAVHDMLTVLKRRFPVARIIIYPAVVQGDDAPLSLRQALALANAQAICDVLIVGRGGGSLEDLWAFNNEHLVREVHASEIPIVSAVGHEVDFTLCDFAADIRAPTPSAAAEAVTPDASELLEFLRQQQAQMLRTLQHKLTMEGQRVEQLRSRLVTPQAYIVQQQQRVDYLVLRIQSAMKRYLEAHGRHLQNLSSAVERFDPIGLLSLNRVQYQALYERLAAAFDRKLGEGRMRLAQQAELLNAISPLQTLQRGYAIVKTPAGRQQVVSSVRSVKIGDALAIHLNDGQITASVDAVQVASEGNEEMSNIREPKA